jgi:hypothetical protein
MCQALQEHGSMEGFAGSRRGGAIAAGSCRMSRSLASGQGKKRRISTRKDPEVWRSLMLEETGTGH